MSLKSKVTDNPVQSLLVLLIVCLTCCAFFGCTAQEIADFNADVDKLQEEVDRVVLDVQSSRETIDSFQIWAERFLVAGGTGLLGTGGLGLNALRKKKQDVAA